MTSTRHPGGIFSASGQAGEGSVNETSEPESPWYWEETQHHSLEFSTWSQAMGGPAKPPDILLLSLVLSLCPSVSGAP